MLYLLGLYFDIEVSIAIYAGTCVFVYGISKIMVENGVQIIVYLELKSRTFRD